ncbi:Glycosyltransferase involved in cell wall bisynthesis [Microbacterium sp. LKL04]|uniref:glycosyltransferase family 4 protein n=1 Tax=Microbacterium sp. LKL04 TaxID=912630 RepID=UPI000875DA76|nr:glycosyltransferase family 4 protein [Microbacterium sp. LKL04]SCY47152.1 Glycosyltransferase involved in cell wall bisynthesis [Microbacterium sp. LKL04]
MPLPGVSILSLHYPPEPTGNAPYAGSLSKGLHALGHRVDVTTTHPHYPEWKIRAGYGQWSRTEVVAGLRVRRLRHYVPSPPRGFKRLASELSFGVRLFFARTEGAVIICVSPSLFASALAAFRNKFRLRRRPLIVWVQDIYTLGLAETGQGNRLASTVTRGVESWTLREADQVVVVHQRFADWVANNLGVDRQRITVVRNWTHLPPAEATDRDAARDALGWPTDRTVAVHAGNMGAKQGLENVVEAARLADSQGANVLFILLGNGSERAHLQSIAAGIERLRFVDSLEDREFRLALAAADVLLVNEKPGVSGMAVPSKLTSYFDAARPVVAATDVQGITADEVRNAGAGLVVEAGRPEDLLNAVFAIGSEPSLAGSLGASGRAYRERVLDINAAWAAWSRAVSNLLSA